MEVGDLVSSKDILFENGTMDSRSDLNVRKWFSGLAVVLSTTETRAKIMLYSGDTMLIKIRHLEVVNGRES